MKTVYKYILVFAAALSFTPALRADDDPAAGIVLKKTLSELDQTTGTYTLTLDSYVKGSAQSNPADIVLVLDVSGSMNDNISGGSKIAALRTAVSNFINVMNKNDYYVDWQATTPSQKRDKRLGNRISVVKFASPWYGPDNNNGTANDITEHNTNHGNYNNTEVIRNLTKLGEENNPALSSLLSNVASTNSLYSGGATAADYGMKKAQYLFDASVNTTKAPFANNKVVVLFTDGEPNHSSDFWPDVAGEAIESAYALKSSGVIVYTIGIFGSMNTTTRNQVYTYMNSVSSNYPAARATNIRHNNNYNYSHNGSAGTATYTSHTEAPNKYFKTANSATELNQIFIDIASDAAARNDVTEATTVQDFVTSTFMLPNNASKVNVYTWDCTGEDSWTGKTLWATGSLSDTENEEVQITRVNGETKVNVTGFNYSLNWCGVHANGQYSGKKLSIEIPITVTEEAVGGPHVPTNGEKSGLILPGQTEPVARFITQAANVPVNIWIQKYGLNRGENAKFTIQRKLIPTSSGQTTEWEDFTTIVISGTGQKVTDTEDPYYDYLTSPMAKINGLSYDYYYRVLEEDGTMTDQDWSWSYSSTAKTLYSTEPDGEGHALEVNPIIFVNEKQETTRKHAESVVTNKFKAGEKAVTVDSREFF